MTLVTRLALSTALISGFGLSGCLQAEAPQETSALKAKSFIAQTSSKSKGMVAAANPLAVESGLEILRQGGSAVDAAIAIQATLGLVEPQSSGLGGGAFMVVYDPKKATVWNYNGRETAPQNITPELFLDPETKEPLRYFDGIASGRSTGVPGAVVMLHKAHQDYGTLDWGPQLEPAIKLAEDGFAVSPRMASLVKRMGGFVLGRDANAKAYFFQEDGTTIPEGFIRDNKPYAETLRAIQDNPRALLEGPIAEAIITGTRLEPLPGTLTLEDMAAYQPQKTEALCGTYREHFICGAQPPASGPLAVMSILGTLENFDMAALGQTTQGWHAFMLNNQLTDFSYRPVDANGNPIANAPAPRKRPRSSMAPLIVFNPDGEFLFATGSPGGNSIIAYVAKSVVGLIDWGLTPEEVVKLPNVISRRGRVRLESQDLKAEDTDEIDRGAGNVEYGLPNNIVSELEAMGHKVVRSKGEISGLHIIYRQKDGALIGGADPRREGIARGL